MRTGAQRRVFEVPCSAALINLTESSNSDRRRCQLPVSYCQCTLRSLGSLRRSCAATCENLSRVASVARAWSGPVSNMNPS